MATAAEQMYAIVTVVGQCMADELAATGGGPVDRVCLLVPGEIAQDDCDCGQFAQTITSVYPSQTLPNPSTGANDTKCGPPYVVVAVKAQTARCVPVMNEAGDPPACTALAAAGLTWLKDGMAMRKGAGCCLNAMYRGSPPQVAWFSIGQVTPTGPEGGCVGAEVTYLVAFNSCICPD